MTYRRNVRRRNIAKKAWPPNGKAPQAITREHFWLYTEPARQRQRIHAALMRARDHDDARRARNGLKPRDAFWQRLGAVAS